MKWATHLAALAGICALPSLGQAQSEKAAASQLFEDAQTLAARGEMAKACAKYDESQRLDPQLGTLLYLSDCYDKLGKTASAWASFRDAIEIAAKRGDRREASARAKLAELEGRLSRLTIELPTNPPPNLEIKRDGVIVSGALFGSAIPVDPGELVIVATAEGFEPWQKAIRVTAEAANIRVEIPDLRPRISQLSPPPSQVLLDTGEPATLARPGVETSPPGETDTRATRRLVGYLVGGAGCVALGVGAVFGLAMKAKVSDRDQANSCSSAGGCTTAERNEINRLTGRAQAYAITADIGFGVGAVALAAGAILIWTGTAAPDSTTSTSYLQPWIGRSSAGLAAGGSF